jgi:hypothetical protein
MQDNTAPVFDLDALDPKALSNEGAWVDIRLDNEPIGLQIRVQGRFSDAYERHNQTFIRQQRAEFKRTGKMPMSDPSDDEERRIELAVLLSIDWQGKATKDKPFSKEGIRAVYKKQPWILEQVDRAVMEDARFLKR